MKLTAAVVTAVLLACPAFAQGTNCKPSPQVVQDLRENHGEDIVAYGIANGGVMLQFWANEQTGSWTIVTTNGPMACVRAYGGDFTRTKPAPNI